MKPASKNILFWGAWSIFFGAAAFPLIDIAVDRPMGYTTEAGFGPETWPRIVAVAAMCLCVFQTIHSCICPENERESLGLSVTPNLALCIIGLFVYYGAVLLIGIAPASCIFFLLYARACGATNLKILIPVGIGLSVALYLFFYYGAQISLPAGPFGGLV